MEEVVKSSIGKTKLLQMRVWKFKGYSVILATSPYDTDLQIKKLFFPNFSWLKFTILGSWVMHDFLYYITL